MSDELIEAIRDNVIGEQDVVDGPFGPRRVIYADYTASGRSLEFIEDFIRDAVLPLYANTHSESSGTGRQTTRFREDARETIRRCLGAGPEHAVIFCGSGATAAVDKLINVLNLRIPQDLDDRYGFSAQIPKDERPVVFIGPFEHHSNELPWRESIAEVVTIPEDHDGHIDVDVLSERLTRYRDRPLKIGSFSAASNVTGIMSDTRRIASLLHEYGTLSFWDYAAAAPYVAIDMGPGDEWMSHKDAIFLSPHKLIGGPGTPGILVVRRELMHNRVPAVPGGGTVAYVNPLEHRYLDDPEHREEGGTPAIVESIRAGLVFKLKETVGTDTIRAREDAFIQQAITTWSEHPDLEVLGNPEADRLSIISFVVTHDGRYLHHNFIVALLNDLFGIQSRGGCSCAGPYGHTLLGIDIETSRAFELEITGGCEGIKPGWVRINFNYFISDAVFDYVVAAVSLIADEGWRALPLYEFDAATGLWHHRTGRDDPPLSLHDVTFQPDGIHYEAHRATAPDSQLAHWLDEAQALFRRLADEPPVPAQPPNLSSHFEELRWFLLPDEAWSQASAER